MAENELKRTVRTKGKISDIVILVVGLVVLLGIIVVLAMTGNKGKGENNQPEQPDLSALHQFPAIDFVDSLYYKKVLVSYGDDDESPRDVYYYALDSVGQPTTEKVHETHYYPGNKKYIDGNISNNVRDGLWYAYHPNGNVQTMAYYRNGKEDGQYTVYYENGNVRYTGKYRDGKRIGVWSFYDENEHLQKTENFEKNNNN